jgi:NAD(P)-dependent dehydrogenase (short-subunit alcohol dehydrogenase family)
MSDLFSIEGKTAVVTGGSRGIGLMIARGFVEAGAKVYISSRKADVCEEVAAELSKVGSASPCPPTCPPRTSAGAWPGPWPSGRTVSTSS